MKRLTKKKRRKLGLDLNGVIANDGQLKSDIVKELYDLEIKAGEFTREIVVKEKKLLTNEQYNELQRFIYQTDVGLYMPAVEGAIDHVRLLAELDFELLVVTSHYGHSLRLAEELLKRYQLFDLLEVHGVELGQGKDDIIVNLDLDIYIDDDIKKLTDLVRLVPELYLFDWEHNHRFNPNFARRVHSWPEYFQIITREHLHGNRSRAIMAT